MKVAFIVGEFPSISETFILNQITGLLDLGHDVDIFALKGNFNGILHYEIIKYQLEKKTQYFNITDKYLLRLLLAFKHFNKHSYLNKVRLIKSLNIFRYGLHAISLRLFFVLIPFLDDKYDIIFSHFGYLGNLCGGLKNLGVKGKFVTMFHGDDIRTGLIKGRSYYKLLLNNTDCVLAISNYNYSNLIRFGFDPKKIFLHPVGIDIKKFSKKPTLNIILNRKKLIILSVARLVPEKGINYGIEAINLLLKRNPKLQVEYRIIGDGPLKKKLIIKVNDLGLNKMIKFLGYQNQKQIIYEMKNSDLFLLSSIAEALPVSLMEAQAVGLPAVASKVGSVNEILIDGKTGFLSKSGDADSISEKLELLLRNRHRWQEFGECGRMHIEKNYNITRLNEKLVKIYKEIIGEQGYV